MKTKAALVVAVVLLQAVQLPGAQQPLKVTVFQLKEADAKRTTDILTTILNGRGARLAVDDRTNSIVLAADADTTELAWKLIARLDAPPPPKK